MKLRIKTFKPEDDRGLTILWDDGDLRIFHDLPNESSGMWLKMDEWEWLVQEVPKVLNAVHRALGGA